MYISVPASNIKKLGSKGWGMRRGGSLEKGKGIQGQVYENIVNDMNEYFNLMRLSGYVIGE